MNGLGGKAVLQCIYQIPSDQYWSQNIGYLFQNQALLSHRSNFSLGEYLVLHNWTPFNTPKESKVYNTKHNMECLYSPTVLWAENNHCMLESFYEHVSHQIYDIKSVNTKSYVLCMDWVKCQVHFTITCQISDVTINYSAVFLYFTCKYFGKLYKMLTWLFFTNSVMAMVDGFNCTITAKWVSQGIPVFL